MNISEIASQALAEIERARGLGELEAARVKHLGRKSELIGLLRSLKDMPLSERKQVSMAANVLKEKLLDAVKVKQEELLSRGALPRLDVTRPGERIETGHMHPLTLMYRRVRDIFVSMNFSVVDGPEVESEHYNFDVLNMPPDHPARDMWDTFWLMKPGMLLRTHTSSMQVRYMETHEPPFQIIVPGRVFRYEATDASHETNLYQVEGLAVGRDVSLANLKYTIETMLKRLFGAGVKFRFRPSYFPFTEPSIEVDVKLGSRWLELMGAGMVHRNVFDAARYNPRDVQGFAFGVGLDRLAMIKYGIPDIRLMYSGDMRFVKQF
ncbi:phenylalanine--tRNA ligase subunit alpha [Candidatus Jorgensenbacteria bacterium GWA1_54_12]|uniref:Phenylalanine--tRNA ligase alpha subunit n=1 Tax=Candidatus Jorgensenbacteria bacterium GWA1_54_12 TaxID=1798468 RepID=A0A1F6BLD8_9BACT|nr:MAG: phenylalanine--tRNA ligase subunit alpha [Candidatus Jorgensenbacteria bacterium GWA1_54_12]